MRHDSEPALTDFDPDDYAALREFFPAYLHQDFADEYGTPQQAVKEFLQEASGDEIDQVRDEWHLLRKSLRKRPFSEMQKAMKRLGCAWVPENDTQLKGLDSAFGDTK